MRGSWVLELVVGLAIIAGGLAWVLQSNWASFLLGSAAFQLGDYAGSRAQWLPLAEEGDAMAQFNLGVMYNTGQGALKDYAEAARWFRLATDQGNAKAQNGLGTMYEIGNGVAQSYTEAASLYRLSASQGNARAQNNLARLYIQGKGVPQDPITAHMWANIASANGSENAPAFRDSIAATLTPADLSEAQRRARECLASNYTRCD